MTLDMVLTANLCNTMNNNKVGVYCLTDNVVVVVAIVNIQKWLDNRLFNRNYKKEVYLETFKKDR